MTDGMKSGAGSDPFANDSNSTDEEESPDDRDVASQQTDQETESVADTDPSSPTTAASTESGQNDDRLPYIFQRNGVKDDRRMTQYFLREETEEIEKTVQQAVEEELGTDVYLTDLREALVRVGAEHLDEVANELRDWGYRFREE